MSYVTALGIVAFAKDDVQAKEIEIHCAWFEGFAHGMNEAGAITGKELEKVIDSISAMRPKER
jgi:hypothetical protein